MSISVSGTVGAAEFSVANPQLILDVSANDTMGILIIGIRGTQTITSVTDSNGANWSVGRDDTGASPGTAIYYTTDLATTGTRTITVNLSAAAEGVFDGWTLTGTKTTIGVTNVGSGTGTNASTSITAATGDSSIVWVAAQASNNTVGSYGIGQVQQTNFQKGGAPGGRLSLAGTIEFDAGTSANAQTGTYGGSAAWIGTAIEVEAIAVTFSPIVRLF